MKNDLVPYEAPQDPKQPTGLQAALHKNISVVFVRFATQQGNQEVFRELASKEKQEVLLKIFILGLEEHAAFYEEKLAKTSAKGVVGLLIQILDEGKQRFKQLLEKAQIEIETYNDAYINVPERYGYYALPLTDLKTIKAELLKGFAADVEVLKEFVEKQRVNRLIAEEMIRLIITSQGEDTDHKRLLNNLRGRKAEDEDFYHKGNLTLIRGYILIKYAAFIKSVWDESSLTYILLDDEKKEQLSDFKRDMSEEHMETLKSFLQKDLDFFVLSDTDIIAIEKVVDMLNRLVKIEDDFTVYMEQKLIDLIGRDFVQVVSPFVTTLVEQVKQTLNSFRLQEIRAVVSHRKDSVQNLKDQDRLFAMFPTVQGDLSVKVKAEYGREPGRGEYDVWEQPQVITYIDQQFEVPALQRLHTASKILATKGLDLEDEEVEVATRIERAIYAWKKYNSIRNNYERQVVYVERKSGEILQGYEEEFKEPLDVEFFLGLSTQIKVSPAKSRQYIGSLKRIEQSLQTRELVVSRAEWCLQELENGKSLPAEVVQPIVEMIQGRQRKEVAFEQLLVRTDTHLTNHLATRIGIIKRRPFTTLSEAEQSIEATILELESDHDYGANTIRSGLINAINRRDMALLSILEFELDYAKPKNNHSRQKEQGLLRYFFEQLLNKTGHNYTGEITEEPEFIQMMKMLMEHVSRQLTNLTTLLHKRIYTIKLFSRIEDEEQEKYEDFGTTLKKSLLMLKLSSSQIIEGMEEKMEIRMLRELTREFKKSGHYEKKVVFDDLDDFLASADELIEKLRSTQRSYSTRYPGSRTNARIKLIQKMTALISSGRIDSRKLIGLSLADIMTAIKMRVQVANMTDTLHTTRLLLNLSEEDVTQFSKLQAGIKASQQYKELRSKAARLHEQHEAAIPTFLESLEKDDLVHEIEDEA